MRLPLSNYWEVESFFINIYSTIDADVDQMEDDRRKFVSGEGIKENKRTA